MALENHFEIETQSTAVAGDIKSVMYPHPGLRRRTSTPGSGGVGGTSHPEERDSHKIWKIFFGDLLLFLGVSCFFDRQHEIITTTTIQQQKKSFKFKKQTNIWETTKQKSFKMSYATITTATTTTANAKNNKTF